MISSDATCTTRCSRPSADRATKPTRSCWETKAPTRCSTRWPTSAPRRTTSWATPCTAGKPAELLAALKDSLGVLDPEEKPLGRAYALGFLCHYALDSTVHPLVYCHEHALCDAGEPGLTRDDGSEVHGVIESELDEMVLFAKRGDTVAAFNPSREILHASEAVLGAVSKMYAYLALNVYGEVVPHNLFRLSVHGFRLVQRLFWSPTGIKRDLIGRIERLARPAFVLPVHEPSPGGRRRKRVRQPRARRLDQPLHRATCAPPASGTSTIRRSTRRRI